MAVGHAVTVTHLSGRAHTCCRVRRSCDSSTPAPCLGSSLVLLGAFAILPADEECLDCLLVNQVEQLAIRRMRRPLKHKISCSSRIDVLGCHVRSWLPAQ